MAKLSNFIKSTDELSGEVELWRVTYASILSKRERNADVKAFHGKITLDAAEVQRLKARVEYIPASCIESVQYIDGKKLIKLSYDENKAKAHAERVRKLMSESDCMFCEDLLSEREELIADDNLQRYRDIKSEGF